MSQPHRRGVCVSLACTLSLCLVLLSAPPPAAAQAQIFQYLALREIVALPIAGRDGVIAAYIYPGSPYPFGNLGQGFAVGSVCAPGPGSNPQNGIWLSAGQGYGDMVAYTPTGSPFPAGQADPPGKTELCNPESDDTWWFAYGNSLNNSPLLTGRFFGNDDELQIPTCNVIPTPEEGILFLERRSADRQLFDIACQNRDPNYTLRVGTVLLCSFANTWLDGAGNNLVPVLESCERYLACGSVPFGGNVARGQGCAQTTTTPPQPPPGQPPVVQCSTTQQAGGDTPDTRVVELVKRAGTFQFDFETYQIPDQIIVSYEGQVLLDTGCVGTNGSQQLTYSGNSSQVQVQVIPNCTGGTTGTQWTWTAYCP
jgi:hypothetical protein